MKTCLLILGAVLLPWTVALAEEAPLPPTPPADLAEAGEPGGVAPDPSGALPEFLMPELPGAAALGDPGAAGAIDLVRPEPLTPALPEGPFVPAVLSVARVKQYPDGLACQLWLKLENRLPFAIRNLTLRFSGYVAGEDYDKPVLFDVVTRSFSEMRPTDVQYRDVFFEHSRCADLAFVKVEDTGRCAMGQLTKFSSQSGDCVRYLRVEPSDTVCMYADDGRFPGDQPLVGGLLRTADSPCGQVADVHVDELLGRLAVSYQAGDTEAFAALFDAGVNPEDGGLDALKEDFAARVAAGKARTLTVTRRTWESRRSGTARVTFSADLEADVARFWGGTARAREVLTGELEAVAREGGLAITRFVYATAVASPPAD
jgi:hypothetical protein